MKLTKDCKAVLDTVISIEPDNGLRFYTNDYVINQPSLAIPPEKFMSVLDTLVELHAIQWGDKEHTAFSMTEIGQEYKQIDRLEKRDRWKARIAGFLTGVGGTVLAEIIIKMILQ